MTLRRGSRLVGVAVVALLVALPAAAETGGIAEYAVPTAGSQPVGIVTGSDGALWFTEFLGNQIGRVTTDGSFTEFPIPTAASRPDDMAVGPDGNVWFAEVLGNKIARITPTGAISEFPVPTPDSRPTAVAAGPDGNLWFTERSTGAIPGKLGRITTGGVITEYALASNGHPLVITAGPDGNMWFTESPGNRIGRIDPESGAISEFPVPTPMSAPWEITAGPDGNVWFTELLGNKVGRIDPADPPVISEFPVPTPASLPNTIRRGPDPNAATDCSFQLDTLGVSTFMSRYSSFGGCVAELATTKTLWFTEQNGSRVAQITTGGTIFEFPLPTSNSQPVGITQGPDGAVWFAEFGGNKIGRLDVQSVGKPAAPGTRSDANAGEEILGGGE